MRWRSRTINCFLFVLFVFLSCVSAWPATTPEAALVSIRIVPQNVKIGGGENPSQHLIVLAQYADGIERDVTSRAAFSLSDPAKGAIDSTGKFIPRGQGHLILTARFGSRTGKADIQTEASGQKLAFSFGRDIGGIFTRRGCNSTSCHGGVKGKGGLKLSINAMYPRDDYNWIVEGGTYKVLTADPGAKNPRVDLKQPEKSLLLLKPTVAVPHGGGQRLKADSRDYETILKWARSGAPYGEDIKGGTSIKRLEVFPKEAVLDAGGRQQLLVTAYLSNGSRQDMTEDVLYDSNDPGVVGVSDTGVVEAKRTGETAVLIRAAGYMLSATIGVIQKPARNYPRIEGRNYIDKYVFAKLRKFNIVPSPLSSDEEFLRRICLDLAGTLPPPGRVREFIADKDPNKRDRLIDRLLNSPEYVDYWSFRFEDLMRATFGTSNRNYMAKAYEDWVTDSIASNKPYDQMARERIAAQGYSAPARNLYLIQGLVAPEVSMPEMVRVFMGRRIECAQCHNHPFEAWSQDQFWGLAAFYGGVTELTESKVVLDAMGRSHLNQFSDMKVINPRTKAKVVPAFLDGSKLPPDQWTDPRMKLADWMTSHPYFAEGSANRIWSYFFGRGIVDPVDDFRSTNPPTHPELLNALANDFRDSGYDLKHLIRTIAESRTYQLSSATNETNKDDVVDYSHAPLRPLEAAVLLDAISSVTQVPEKFQIDAFAGAGEAPPGTPAVQIPPEICPSQFMDAFGRSMRKALPVGTPQPNLLEAMHMFAGSTYTSKITEAGGRLDRLLKKNAPDEEIINDFYLSALARLPAPDEKADLLAFLRQRSARRQQELARLVWAVISSREFAYNH